MEAKDIPFFAVLIFPGFFAIQAFFWSAHSSKMSDLMRIVWSFLYSTAIFLGLHGFFRHVLSL